MANAEAALELARQLAAPGLEAEALPFRAEVRRLSRRNEEARVDIEDALAISRVVGMDYMGPVVLGILARVAEDGRTRSAALAEAEALLGTYKVAHNHLLFRRDAIEIYIETDEWDAAEKQAGALRSFTNAEPLAWSTFLAARGLALAAVGRRQSVNQAARDELARIAGDARSMGYLISLPELEALI